MSRLKIGVRTVARVVGVLVCIGFAELCRRGLFIVPDWRGQLDWGVMFFISAGIICLLCIGELTYQIAEDWRRWRLSRPEREALRRQRENREKVFRLWSSTF